MLFSLCAMYTCLYAAWPDYEQERERERGGGKEEEGGREKDREGFLVNALCIHASRLNSEKGGGGRGEGGRER